MSRAVGRSVRALPIKLQDNGPIDDRKTQQSDPAESNAAEYAGLEVQDEHLAAKGQRQLFSSALLLQPRTVSHDQSSRQPQGGSLPFPLCRVLIKNALNHTTGQKILSTLGLCVQSSLGQPAIL